MRKLSKFVIGAACASCLSLGVAFSVSSLGSPKAADALAAVSAPTIQLLDPVKPSGSMRNDVYTLGSFDDGYLTGSDAWIEAYNGPNIEYLWLDDCTFSQSGGVYDLSHGNYHWKRYTISQTDFLQLGINDYHQLWPELLASSSEPVLSGVIRWSQTYNDGDDTYWSVALSNFGLFRPTPKFYSSVHVLYSDDAYGDMLANGDMDFSFSPSYYEWELHYLPSSDIVDYVLNAADAGRYLRDIDVYWLLYKVADAFYGNGMSDGRSLVISTEYGNMTYQQIYDAGKRAGRAEASPTQIDLYSMFAAVLTMPFTFMASTFDTTLFAGTQFAFNVSIFIYSVFIVLLIWKILSLVFRGK